MGLGIPAQRAKVLLVKVPFSLLLAWFLMSTLRVRVEDVVGSDTSVSPFACRIPFLKMAAHTAVRG